MFPKMSQPNVVDRNREAACAVFIAERIYRPVAPLDPIDLLDFYLRSEARAARAAVLDRLMRDAASCAVVRVPGSHPSTVDIGCYAFDPSTGLGCGSFCCGGLESPCPRHGDGR